jgi:hypothetical protein
MESNYLVQIVHRKSGLVVQWAPGLNVEDELIDTLCERVRAKGIGIGRTEAHVLGDVRAALEELLFDLKSQV